MLNPFPALEVPVSLANVRPEPGQGALTFVDPRLYLACAALVLGNVLLPLALHRLPGAGAALMPILFFTLVAGWRFGLRAAALTAVLSPLANHALTGMPPAPALQGLILQSALLGILAALAAARRPRPTLPLLAAVVLASQGLILLAATWQAGFPAGMAGVQHRLPAVLLQILGGWAALRLLDRFLPAPSVPEQNIRA
jgi:hypothetical protein